MRIGDVADPGERQRNDGCRARSHQRARQHQHLQAVGEHGQYVAKAAPQGGPGNDAELAQAVAQRAVKQLQHTIHNRKHRDHLRRLRQSDSELT